MTAPKDPKRSKKVAAPSRAKRSQTTAIGRSVLTKQRQSLAREQARLEAQRLAQLDRRRRYADLLNDRATDEQLTFNVAMQRSVIKRTNGVLISEGINVPINASGVNPLALRAWTDFNAIYVYYPIYETQPELTAAVIRGLMYHEGGHIRFTHTFAELVRMFYTEQNWIIPRGDDQLMSDLVYRFKAGNIGLIHKAWNMLEDQRMETAVVSDSPRKAAYFAPMVLSHFLSDPDRTARNWPYLIWRRYLSHNLRRRARAMFVAYYDKSLATGEAEQLAQDITAITDRYVRGMNASDLMFAVQDLFPIVQRLRMEDATGEHKGGVLSRKPGSQPPPDFDIPIAPDMDEDEPDEDDTSDDESDSHESEGDDEDAETDSTDSDDASDDEDDDAADDDASDPADDEADGGDPDDDSDDDHTDEFDNDDTYPSVDDDDDEADDGGTGAGGESDDDDDEPLTQEELDEALRQAEAERAEDETLAEDVRQFNEARNNVDSLLPPAENKGIVTDGAAVAIAMNTAEDMRRSFEAATVNVAPNWEEQQRRGIINVLRYETRQPGDTEFFKNYNNDGNPGYDIAVTVMLDNSGSMNMLTMELAKAAFASKVACQDLGIPCTVVLWNDKASVLWTADDRAENMMVVSTRGGTDPTMALEDLNNHVYGKPKHVVLIMTDGEWEEGVASLSNYDQPGRYFVGCSYGTLEGITGAHVKRQIKSVLEVPAILEQALVECVR